MQSLGVMFHRRVSLRIIAHIVLSLSFLLIATLLISVLYNAEMVAVLAEMDF